MWLENIKRRFEIISWLNLRTIYCRLGNKGRLDLEFIPKDLKLLSKKKNVTDNK